MKSPPSRGVRATLRLYQVGVVILSGMGHVVTAVSAAEAPAKIGRGDAMTDDLDWDVWEGVRFALWASKGTAKRAIATNERLWGPGITYETMHSIRDEAQLSAHQFLNAVGILLRALRLGAERFPELQPYKDTAPHLSTEGTALRNMWEHYLDQNRGYLLGSGTKQKDFVRNEAGISCDAVSCITDDEGLKIGNRLLVPRCVAEIDALIGLFRTVKEPD